MRHVYLTACILCSVVLVEAQDFSYPVTLQSVTYSGGSMYNLRKDDGTGYIDNSVHWTNTGTVNPAGFPSGAVINASAVFSLDCDNLPASVYIRGNGPDSLLFPTRTITPAGSTVEYPATPASHAFAENTVRYYAGFIIQWQISFDSIAWHDAGESNSPVYVTLHNAKPENAFGGFKYYYTLIDLGCRNADGDTTNDAMIDDVWSEFTDHSVLNAQGLPLYYYKELFSPNVTLASLLKYRDGECYTWAQLFLACLKMQGFSQSSNYMNITADYSGTSCGSISRFLVKNWNFGVPSDDCADMPYLDVYASDYYDADTAYLYAYAEVTDSLGVMGQTAPNPASSFGNHQIAIVNGKYYDASYGVLYENFEDIRYGALSGWSRSETSNEVAIGIDVNGNGVLDPAPDFTILRVTPDIDMADFDPYIETW